MNFEKSRSERLSLNYQQVGFFILSKFLELIAKIGQTPSEEWSVNGEDQSLKAGTLGTTDEVKSHLEGVIGTQVLNREASASLACLI